MKKLLIVALVLAACGSKSEKSADNNGGGDACTVATAKAVDQMIGTRLKRMESRAGSDMTDRKAKVEEQATQLKTVLAKHCNDDKWAADVVDCFGAAATREAMQACRAKLPQDQQQALMADEMKVMMAGRGNGMHGMGGGFRHEGGSGSAMGTPQPDGSATTPPATGSGSATGSATPAAGSGSAAKAPAGSGSAK